MTTDRVMLLIDADNVSMDVIDQAVRLLMKQHGALHVRRAYCTPEGALKHQAVFKRLGIKPMVNLAAGKNSTDIALAVDAIDLVLAERPDVVAIASSDSDFAPLVHRLREKGCVVRGIGQKGKVGDETQDVYDDFTVLEHHKAAAAAPSTDKPARKTARRPPAKPSARAAATTPAEAAEEAAPAPAAARVAVQADAPAAAPARKAAAKTARKTASKTPAKSVVKTSPEAPVPAAPAPSPARAQAVAQAVADIVAAKPDSRQQPPAPPRSSAETARQILESMPELNGGERLELRVASQRLREAGLLSKSGSSTKLLGQFPELFELLPPGQPNHLRLRR